MLVLFLIHVLSLLANSGDPCLDRKMGKVPPGTKKIAENFYVDKKEVSILDYRFYQYWLKTVLGEDSAEYLSSFPDTSAVKVVLHNPDATSIHAYLTAEKFENYPIICITYDQAIAYAKWRSDRVYENLLVSKGLIRYNEEQNSENFFSIEKYIAREYPVVRTYAPIPYPVYRLPSEVEWEEIARRVRKKDHVDLTERNRIDIPFNQFSRIVGIAGNVSEMVVEEGACKGANWTDPAASYPISSKRHYTGVQSWLGVRYVCSWHPIL